MVLENTAVFLTDNGDGSADVTVADHSIDEDYRFSLSMDGGDARISYEETLSWRGEIRVKEPSDEVFKTAMLSDPVTNWLDEVGASGIRRA